VVRGRSRWGLRIAAAIVAFECGAALAQFHHHAKAAGATPSANLTFMKRDGSCVTGPILRIEPKVVTVQLSQTDSVTIQRLDLLQASQEDALVFSARSSWADVEAVQLRARESFLVKTRNGKAIKGRPLRVTADGIVYKRFLWITKRYGKDQIVMVDYLRMKPESDAFDNFAQEGPAMLFFYPEFYDRLKGLEGRIPVRLYDAVMREDDAILQCLRR